MNRIVQLDNFNKLRELKQPDIGNGTEVKKAILMAKLPLELAHEGGCYVTYRNMISNLQVSSPVDIIMVIVINCWGDHVTI